MPTSAEKEAIAYLRSLTAIRERCTQIFEFVERGDSAHFQYRPERFEALTAYVTDVIRANYPDLNIPIHSRFRHFAAGDPQREQRLYGAWDCDRAEQVRRKLDLSVVSVLLDAGAGPHYKYAETDGDVYARSEALGIASWHMFADGLFSSNPNQPHQVNARALQNLTAANLQKGFQLGPDNPLTGFEGRLKLLQRLGTVLEKNPQYFGASARPGNMLHYLQEHSTAGSVHIDRLWEVVVDGLYEMWPDSRSRLAGVNLGDVWAHSALKTDQFATEYVPFHKLSQWLTYSLLEPLTEAGLQITGLEQLTGLAEYRNGGLFVDLGLLELRDPDAPKQTHTVDSELIIEWRALTVLLLDLTAKQVRQSLLISAEQLPLMNVLEGGTWAAGRKIARELRTDGGPPLRIQSDGTVF